LKYHISFWFGKHEWSLSIIALGVCEQSGSSLLPCYVHCEIEKLQSDKQETGYNDRLLFQNIFSVQNLRVPLDFERLVGVVRRSPMVFSRRLSQSANSDTSASVVMIKGLASSSRSELNPSLRFLTLREEPQLQLQLQLYIAFLFLGVLAAPAQEIEVVHVGLDMGLDCGFRIGDEYWKNQLEEP
jgi:hypothetical protein